MANETLPIRGMKVHSELKMGANLAPRRVYVVDYYLGPHGPFQFELEPNDYTAARIMEEIERNRNVIQAVPVEES